MAGNMSLESPWDGPTSISLVSTDYHLKIASLPVPRTSFIGRQREVDSVRTLLLRDDVRIITVTGPGGVGKTRIAIRSVTSAAPSALFVELSNVRQPELVIPTIAAALGIRPDGRPALDQLRAVLRQDDHLLLLDNFEQVLPAASALADLLDACPGVKLLVTSQSVLQIPGEHVIDILPFPVPVVPYSGNGMVAGDVDACRLFVERAQAHDAEFTMTMDNAATVIAICRHLDGMPLAIELAASWVSVLSPAMLLAQLDKRLTLPGTGSQVAPQRQRGLREAISWSHGLLGASSKVLFRRLACFSGGATLEALTDVCGNDSLDVLRELRTLIGNSLVRRTDSLVGDPRYIMLESVREFGVERLRESDESEVILRRHASHFLHLAEQVESNLNTIEREDWLDRLDMEQGNIHSALAWAIEQEDGQMAVALCGALLPFWQFRFHSGEGRAWVSRALALDHNLSPSAARKATYCAGILAYMHGDSVGAAQHFTDALACYPGSDDPELTGRIELALGRIAWDAGEQDTAHTSFLAAKDRFDRCGDRSDVAVSLHYLGLVAFKDGDYLQAATLLQDALSMWRSLGFTWELARCIPGHLADVARAKGDFANAIALYQECLAFNWEHQDLENVSWSLAGLAMIAASQAKLNLASNLMALAERFEKLTGAPLTPHIYHDHGIARRMVVDAVGAEAFAAIETGMESADLAIGISSALALSFNDLSAVVSANSGPGLTPREQDVLRMIAAGLSNQDIADALFVSVGTVKVHVTHILAKLGVKSRGAAAGYAHRHDLA
jgi:non-specific serine/threonine protein kinase